MTKKDLDSIIRKIQNRCYLEEPTKITYYWNENKEVVFKVFFDSLALPECLRLGVEEIQNTFITQNTYEYNDDFKILSLNQDKGYVEFLPDNQHFKIINSYKEAKENLEEKTVCLTTKKRLNEAFSKLKGFILQEDERISNEGDFIRKAKENGEDATIEKKKKVAYVIGIDYPCVKEADVILEKCVEVILQDTSTDTSEKLVVFTSRLNPLNEDLPSSLLSFSSAAQKAVTKALGSPDTLSYLGLSGNESVKNVLKSVGVIKTLYLTSTAEEAIQANNITKISSAEKGELPKGFSMQIDNTKEVIEPVLNAYLKKASKFKKFADSGEDKKELHSKENLDRLKEAGKAGTKTAKLLSFVKDLYKKSGIPEFEKYQEERVQEINKLLRLVKNPTDSKESLSKEEAYKLSVLNMEQALYSVLTGMITDRKQVGVKNNSSTEPTMQLRHSVAYNAASETDKGKDLKKAVKKGQKLAETDFKIYMLFKDKGTGFKVYPEDTQNFLNVLSENAFEEPEGKIEEPKEEADKEEEKSENEKDSENRENSEKKETTSPENEESKTSGNSEQTSEEPSENNGSEIQESCLLRRKGF